MIWAKWGFQLHPAQTGAVPGESNVMQQHPPTHDLLKKLFRICVRSGYTLAIMKMDGTGYPRGLKEISLWPIFSVADV
jgi:HD-GYP domain-containing protein (c-di-GMP phosphodiesterase class II)